MGYNDRGSREDKPRELHKAVCAECGKDCEVPFKPTTGKNVRCRDCYKQSDQGRKTDVDTRGGRPGFRDRPKPAAQVDYTKQIAALGSKLDTIIRLLETGSTERPVRPEGTEQSREREERAAEKQVDHDELKDIIEETSQD